MHHLPLAFLTSVSALASPAASQELEFDSPWQGYDTSVYPEAINPWAARSADFDGDGDLDVATVAWYANPKLSVLLNEGSGTFAPPAIYNLTLASLDLEVGDFDLDGDVDIAASSTGQFWEGQAFQLFRNLGNGTFAPGGSFMAGNGPTGMTAADFDLDGYLDIAVAHDEYIDSANSIAWMHNNAGTGFGAPHAIAMTQGTHKITSGDMNGDLYPDLVVAHESNGITVLLNNGGSGFGSGTFYGSLPTGYFRTSPNARLADVDSDGDPDVLYSHTDLGFPNGRGAIALYRNHGDGTLDPAEEIPLLAGEFGMTDIEYADVTGDGVPDILGSTEGSQVWLVLPGDGMGGFGAARPYRAGESPIAVEVGDLDGDTDRDVVVIGRDSLELCVYKNPGDGSFLQPPVIEMVEPNLAPVSFSNLASSDIDGDGDLDLVVGYSANWEVQYGISVRRNQGDGTFAARENYPAPSYPTVLHLRDLSGDGFDDVLWIDDADTARFRYRLNLGDGSFGPSKQGPIVNCVPEAIEAADVDGDGDNDVLVGCYFDVYVSLNQGGTFGPYHAHSIGGGAGVLTLADFDHDDDLDLVTNSGPQGYAEVSLGLGDGSFEPPFFVQTGRAVTAAATGDVDSDGNLDMAVAYGLDGNGLTIARGRGDGSFRPPVSYHGAYSSTYDNVKSIVLGDVDEDGDLDALSAYYGSQEVVFWRNQGDGTYDEGLRYGVGQRAWDLALGDFDGDLVEDLAVLVEPISSVNHWYYPGIVVLGGRGNGSGCPPPEVYCVGAPNSAGAGARMGWTGTTSISANEFTLTTVGAVPDQFGLCFYGATETQVPFGDGFRCIAGSMFRLNPPQYADASGHYFRLVDFTQPPAGYGAGRIEPGSTWRFQCWYRDPAFGGSGFNLSDALSAVFCP